MTNQSLIPAKFTLGNLDFMGLTCKSMGGPKALVLKSLHPACMMDPHRWGIPSTCLSQPIKSSFSPRWQGQTQLGQNCMQLSGKSSWLFMWGTSNPSHPLLLWGNIKGQSVQLRLSLASMYNWTYDVVATWLRGLCCTTWAFILSSWTCSELSAQTRGKWARTQRDRRWGCTSS